MGRIHGGTQASDMKTFLLLLSLAGLALVCAELQHGEDQHTEDANVVAVDDSAAAMDDATDKKDDSRRTGYESWTKTSTAQFRFPGELDADIRVSQTHWEQSTNNAAWHVKFNEFNDDICPGGQLNWHVHQYPVSETASNIRTMNTQIENFNIQNAPIAYFASDGANGANSPTTVTGSAATSITSDGKIRLDWTLTGLDDNSSGGIHIHYGTTCDTEATVKGDAPAGANLGHYYVPDATPDSSEDPWGPVTWNSDGDGNAVGSVEISEAQLGAAAASAYDRVVIVHNNAGKKIGCGVLASYVPTTVTGSVTASTTSTGELKLEWDLEGLTPDTPSTGSGKNGIHIHYGTTCQSEATVKGDAPAGASKGHYYVPASPDAAVLAGEDPWGPVKWGSDGDGKSTGSVEISEADLGATPGSAYNRVVIVHNSAGKKVGCGVLSFQGSAPGCGAGVTGGHYDPTFACGKASQNNANGICAILRATNQAPAGNGLGLVKGPVSEYKSACTADQSQCEIGDQSGKMVKLDANDSTERRYNDLWMKPIKNLAGRSMVLHCCNGDACGARLACANLGPVVTVAPTTAPTRAPTAPTRKPTRPPTPPIANTRRRRRATSSTRRRRR